nr:MAG TPA: hypothetical protein [Caudoviricetes sp.]
MVHKHQMFIKTCYVIIVSIITHYVTIMFRLYHIFNNLLSIIKYLSTSDLLNPTLLASS